LLRAAAGRLSSDIRRRAFGECDVAAGRGLLGGVYGGVVTEYVRTAAP
jgi:hypothetical protein